MILVNDPTTNAGTHVPKELDFEIKTSNKSTMLMGRAVVGEKKPPRPPMRVNHLGMRVNHLGIGLTLVLEEAVQDYYQRHLTYLDDDK